MNIKEMHYDFKMKINKVDSQQYRNLRVPEIDWKINEAIKLFTKIVAEPKSATRLGFELSQSLIDTVRTLVTDSANLVLVEEKTNFSVFTLPTDYFAYVSASEVELEKGSCTVLAEKVIIRQHDDDFQSSEFDKSNFLWREVNARFFSRGLKVFSSEDFSVKSFEMDYIKIPLAVNNCESYPGGTYTTLAGNVLTTNVDCDLPTMCHGEVIDLAVAITIGDLTPDYQIKKDKLNYNQL